MGTEQGREYANECDRLSALAAKLYKKHWGRWYWDNLDKSLGTWIELANDGSLGAFAISLKRLDEGWIGRMRRYKWIGEEGLADLEKAIKLLADKGGGYKHKTTSNR